MLPQTKLNLVYLGLPSHDVRIFSARANDASKPIIYFWEKGPTMQLYKDDNIVADFPFVTEQECLDQLEQEVTNFFD